MAGIYIKWPTPNGPAKALQRRIDLLRVGLGDRGVAGFAAAQLPMDLSSARCLGSSRLPPDWVPHLTPSPTFSLLHPFQLPISSPHMRTPALSISLRMLTFVALPFTGAFTLRLSTPRGLNHLYTKVVLMRNSGARCLNTNSAPELHLCLPKSIQLPWKTCYTHITNEKGEAQTD